MLEIIDVNILIFIEMNAALMKREISWQAPGQPRLRHDEVHLWRASLDQPLRLTRQWWETLSADEKTRADHFYFEKDRLHFIVAHGLLRAILGRYLDLPSDTLSFNTNAYGKPFLAMPLTQQNGRDSIVGRLDQGSGFGTLDGEPVLHFSLSHSHQLALYAFAFEREVGIDVEWMRPLAFGEYDEMAEHFFSTSEQAALRAQSATLKAWAFFHCWTRKEAYIKACGKGLSIPLDQFDVSLSPHEPARLLASREDPEAPARWSMYDFPPGPGYAGALVVEGVGWTPRHWQADLEAI